MIDFKLEAENIKEEIIKKRRDIHENPELDFDLFRTSKVVLDFLKSENIECYSTAKTGVCAIIKGQNTNKVIALRADMDALPIIDKKNVSYKSKVSGKMHACGHDAHTAILLGVAKILNKHKDKLNGSVKLLFEPAEETSGGAPLMIKDLVLENPRVDAIIGLHVSENLDCGKIKVKEGMVNAASNPFSITIVGKGGHGAMPHYTVDPIIITSNLINALQSIRSRELAPVNPAVITIGSIHGGTSSNIIPETIEIKGIIRTVTLEDREYVKKRLVEITSGICESFRGQGIVNIEEGYPSLINNSKMVDRLKKVSSKIIGTNNVLNQMAPSMGVESFAYFAKERPSVFYYLGTKGENFDNPAHGSYFDINEEAIALGMAIQCEYVYDYLTIT